MHHSFLPPLKLEGGGGGVPIFKIWKEGVMQKLLRNKEVS